MSQKPRKLKSIKKKPGEACPRSLWRSFGKSASIYPIDPRLKGIVSAVEHLNFPPFTFLFSVLFSFLYLLFGTLQITRTMLAQSSLFRKLRKVVMPVLLRKKHDYFPRTLKLHNGKKVRNIYQYWTLNIRNSLDLQDEENRFQLHFFFF